MSDFLLEIGKNQHARKIIGGLGVPMPQALERSKGPWDDEPLSGKTILLGSGSSLRSTLEKAGAHVLDEQTGTGLVSGIVYDASKIRKLEDLKNLYSFFHPLVSRLSRCGRIVILGHLPSSEETTPNQTGELAHQIAVQSAVEGFTRSLAKEIGRRGATANLIYQQSGVDEKAVQSLMLFLLSAKSAFVTAQPILVRAPSSSRSLQPSLYQSLKGKSVLVTGAARGIGEATARLLAAEGAHVICLDRPEEAESLEKVAHSIQGSTLFANLSSPESAGNISNELMKRGSKLYGVIHNAGITRDKTLGKMQAESWNQVMDVNLAAIIHINENLLRENLLEEGGRIVCLSSVAGLAGNVGQTNYAASKAGVAGYVRAMSTSLGSRGITLNAVAPGFIETRMTAAIPMFIREAGRRLSALGQGGRPQDVGELITFLTLPASQSISGQVIRVCGGALIGA